MANRELTFEASEFTADDPLAKTFAAPSEKMPVLLRSINELDTQVNVEIELTDGYDEVFDYPRLAGEFTILGGTGNPEDAAGGTASDVLSEPWERVRVTVVPLSAPTAGRLDFITATNK